jgi:hypothetical protein
VAIQHQPAAELPGWGCAQGGGWVPSLLGSLDRKPSQLTSMFLISQCMRHGPCTGWGSQTLDGVLKMSQTSGESAVC